MKPARKLFLILSSVVLFWQCEKEPAPVNIPNSNFLNGLIQMGIDTDEDGKISHSEAEAVGHYTSVTEIFRILRVLPHLSISTR